MAYLMWHSLAGITSKVRGGDVSSRNSNSIPTWHNGILYRSRLEARWSVFFLELGLKFEYETSGFNCGGQWYLPDFLVFGALGHVWVECKPSWQADEDGIAKWRRFADYRPQPSRTALLVGVPSPLTPVLVIGGDDSQDDVSKASWEDDRQEWRPCPSGDHFDLAFPGVFRAKFPEDGCEQKFGGLGEDKIKDAITMARSARFSGAAADPGTAA